MSLESDLDWLERGAHSVDRTPEGTREGHIYYEIDGLPRTPEEIEQWVISGHDPLASDST
ncbi:MAG: hypothetical protein ABI822_31495 [Bryobacteraceae bacterium]